MPSIEANPVDTENASETWARFQVGSVPLQNCAELVFGDKQTLKPKKGIQLEGIQILMHVELVFTITSLNNATPNT